MEKHATLITAYHEFDLLKKLIQLTDDERNDIFVHVDKKALAFNEQDFTNLTRKSKLCFVTRSRVSSGGYSLLNCELVLLKEAMKNHYTYYHLLSGDSLPLKTNDEIHAFFAQHCGKEFLSFDAISPGKKSFYDRFKYYHVFQEIMGRPRKPNFFTVLNKISFKIQDLLRIDRIKDIRPTLKKGLNWFSITHELARFVVDQEDTIRKMYQYTLCPEETFLHTIAWNSPFRENIVNNSLRKSDWKRGQPYIFRNTDFDELINSGAFWARKFSEKVDPMIVTKIFDHLSNH